MDCPRCGTPNMSAARFCRRCGERIPERRLWTLGAVCGEKRYVRVADLRAGRLVEADSWRDRLTRGTALLGDVTEAFYEAARHLTPAARIHLTEGGWEEYRLVVETDQVALRFRVRYPYARIDLDGPREAVREIVRRVVAQHGDDAFAARDGRWERFVERTGLTEAENKTTLLELLS